MLDIKFIRQNADAVKKAAYDKRVAADIDALLETDEKRRRLIGQIEKLRVSKKTASSKRDQEEGRKIKLELGKLENELKTIEEKFQELMLAVPNMPLADVPAGAGENENKILRQWGEPKRFGFEPLDHVELGKKLGIIEIEAASRITGTRFAYLKGGGALLELALLRFAFDVLTKEERLRPIAENVEKGYSAKPFVPVIPPVMIRPEVFAKMGRLNPEDKDERYYLPKDDLYLVGSAEHTLGPLHMDEILNENDLSLRYVGFSTCFRREAGSYGKDTRGILRVHQFDKIEIESFTLPEHSVKEQNFFVAIQEYFMRTLEIPYRVVLMCTGETGKPDARQIDIETWLPGQNCFRETHTADLMTDYQARRLNTRVRRKGGELEFAHMNDATVFAIGRMVIAILENYQIEDGSILVPAVLQEYLGMKKIA